MRCPVKLLLLFGFVTTISVHPSANSSGQEETISPNSDYVEAMVRPAVDYLKENYVKTRDYGNASLVGLAIYNAGIRYGKSKKELVADECLKEILERVSEEVKNITPEGERTIYAACVTGLLLAEVDEQKYKTEIEHILDFVQARQMAHGGWGYKTEPKGDTSQTQYASLFLWLAQQKKFSVKTSVIENAIKFLVATQHQSGGFVYKAEPNQIFGEVTHSLTAAGLGSVYLLGDAYGLHGGEVTKTKRNSDLEWLPPSVSLVSDANATEKPRNKTKRVISGFANSKLRGDAWFRQNFVVNPRTWTYYYLYGFERYSSFKERAENKAVESPTWYVAGAKFLKQNQNGDGSWLSENATERSKDYSTAFAVLFLVRSTELLIPTYVDVVESVGNFSAARPQEFESFVALTASNSDTDWAAFEDQFDSLVLSANQGSRARQLAVLRNLVSHENAVARLVAVKSIGKFRDFDNVPFLIHALSDPEPRIVRIANDGLRFVSRKFDARAISEKPTKQELESLVSYWTKWYQEVVPEGRLLDSE